MQKSPVTMSVAAARRIRTLMKDEISGLRIGLKKGGCAGMEYTMEIVQNPDAIDIVVESDGARVFIAPSAQMYLIGTMIDFKTSLLEEGFEFINPNVSAACGCGESVSFSVDQLRMPAL